MLTQDYVQELFDFDPRGFLIWKISRGRIRINDIAGKINSQGYRAIGVDGKLYLAHRLIWLWYYGEWPEPELDHINGIRDDNRLENLREVTHERNLYYGQLRRYYACRK